MEAININSTEDTPKVILDADANKFELSERSYPEDAAHFYEPILDWLEDYANHCNPSTNFEFKLDYFNTASSKQIFKMLTILKKVAQTSELKISWYHQKQDRDMYRTGQRFAKLLDTPMEFIEY